MPYYNLHQALNPLPAETDLYDGSPGHDILDYCGINVDQHALLLHLGNLPHLLLLGNPQELGAKRTGSLPQSQVWPGAFARHRLRAERGHAATSHLDDLEAGNEDPAEIPGGRHLRCRNHVSMTLPFPQLKPLSCSKTDSVPASRASCVSTTPSSTKEAPMCPGTTRASPGRRHLRQAAASSSPHYPFYPACSRGCKTGRRPGPGRRDFPTCPDCITRSNLDASSRRPQWTLSLLSPMAPRPLPIIRQTCKGRGFSCKVSSRRTYVWMSALRSLLLKADAHCLRSE